MLVILNEHQLYSDTEEEAAAEGVRVVKSRQPEPTAFLLAQIQTLSGDKD